MHKRMTISINEDVHEALLRVIGRGKISQFLEGLAKPYVLKDNLLLAYQEMASDTQREKEALEWSNALIGDVDHAAW